MDGYDVQQRNILQLRQERDAARRWAAAWKESAKENRWNYREAMRQYDAQQKRACEAEALVLRLREALGVLLEDERRLLRWNWIAADESRAHCAYCSASHSDDTKLKHDADCPVVLARAALALEAPATLDALMEQVRVQERERSCAAICRHCATSERGVVKSGPARKAENDESAIEWVHDITLSDGFQYIGPCNAAAIREAADD